jgi:hypothetical protein
LQEVKSEAILEKIKEDYVIKPIWIQQPVINSLPAVHILSYELENEACDSFNVVYKGPLKTTLKESHA